MKTTIPQLRHILHSHFNNNIINDIDSFCSITTKPATKTLRRMSGNQEARFIIKDVSDERSRQINVEGKVTMTIRAMSHINLTTDLSSWQKRYTKQHPHIASALKDFLAPNSHRSWERTCCRRLQKRLMIRFSHLWMIWFHRACVPACLRPRMPASTPACIHACMRPRLHATTHACVHVCMRPQVHASTRTCVRACRRLRVQASTLAGVHACMRPCVHVCMLPRVHASTRACFYCLVIAFSDGHLGTAIYSMV